MTSMAVVSDAVQTRDQSTLVFLQICIVYEPVFIEVIFKNAVEPVIVAAERHIDESPRIGSHGWVPEAAKGFDLF